jgi:hypothetical protein
MAGAPSFAHFRRVGSDTPQLHGILIPAGRATVIPSPALGETGKGTTSSRAEKAHKINRSTTEDWNTVEERRFSAA